MLWQEEDILARKYKVTSILDSQDTPHKSYKVYDVDWDKPFRLKRFCNEIFSNYYNKRQLCYFLQRWISLAGCYEVVGAYYLREIKGHICLISEYIEGFNLEDYIKSNFLETVDAAIDIAIKVAMAILYVEKIKITPSNLKLTNVLITREQHVKIADFTEFSENSKYDYGYFLKALFYTEDEERWDLPKDLVITIQNIINKKLDIKRGTQVFKNIYESVTSKPYLETIQSSRFEIEQSNKQALSFLESEQKHRAVDLWIGNMMQTPPSISASWNWHLLNFRSGTEAFDTFVEETDQLLEQDFERICCARTKLALETGFLLYESLEEILTLHQRVPKTMLSERLEGELYFRLGEHQKAVDTFTNVVRNDSSEGDDWYCLGAAYFENMSYDLAFQTWEEGHQKYPNHLLLLLGKATCLFKQQKLEEAQNILENIAEKYPDIFWANLHAAEFFSGTGLYERNVSQEMKQKAIPYYERIINENPNMIRAIRGYHQCSLNSITERDSKDTLEGWMQAEIIEHPENLVTAIDISSDGEWLASGDCEGNIGIWNTLEKQTIHALQGHKKHISDILLLKEHHKLISGSWDNTVRIWDLTTGECTKILEGHADRISSISATGCGNNVISSSWDGTVKVWDSNSGEILHSLHSEDGWMTDVAFVGSQKITYCDENSNLLLYDLEKQESICKMRGSSIVVSHNLENIISTDSDGIYLWKVADGSLISQIETYDYETGIVLSQDDKFLLTRNEDDMLKIWYLPNKSCVTILYNEEALCGTMTKDAKILVSANGNVISLWQNIFEQYFPLRRKACFLQPQSSFIDVPSLIPQKIRDAQKLYEKKDYSGAHQAYTFLQKIPGYEKHIKILNGLYECGIATEFDIIGVKSCILRKMIHFPFQVWNLDTALEGDIAVFTCGDDPIYLWNLYTDHSLNHFIGHHRVISSLAIGKQASAIISGSWDKTVHLWSVEEPEQDAVLGQHNVSVCCVAMSDCEQYGASADKRGDVYIWDFEQKKSIAHYKWSQQISALKFIDERTVLVCTWSGQIYFWDYPAENIEKSINPHQRHILDISISENKKYFAVSSRNKKIDIFSIDSLELIHTIVCEEIVKCIHLAFNGKIIIATSYTGQVYIWKTDDGSCIYKFQAHCNHICNLKVLKDRFVVTVSDSNEICLFEIDWNWSIK